MKPLGRGSTEEGPSRDADSEEAGSADELLARIQREFVLGGHKAAAIATVLKKAQVYLVSALPADLARTCGMVPYDNLDEAMRAALESAGAAASVSVMPQGASVLPGEVGSAA